ncbi:SIMPL domain-containing protein [Flavobacterium sp.]|uniref:SIMPL domain-containing protein n=1 Tax=Flavobacterium sp. TaxID=239 RepID=UPI003750B34B
MKKILKITLVFLMFANYSIAQSTEKFIRIIGNSSYEFKADTYRVYFNISEIVPNSYNKEEYKSLESNIIETMDFLKKSGIKESQIFKNYKNKNTIGYNSIKSEFYYMDISNKETLSKINSFKNTGFKVEMTKFLYLNIDPNIEINLSKEAINDADRKAKSIAKEVGKKVGKILNIEDKSASCCDNFGEIDQDNVTKKYTLSITFEFLD